MAGKNTAVFGIYTDRSSVDRAVEALKAAGFSNNDVSALFLKSRAQRILPTRRALRHPRVRPLGREREHC